MPRGFFYRFGTTVERFPILLEILTVLPEEVFCRLFCLSLCQQFNLQKIKLKITPCLLCFVRWGVIIFEWVQTEGTTCALNFVLQLQQFLIFL